MLLKNLPLSSSLVNIPVVDDLALCLPCCWGGPACGACLVEQKDGHP